MLLANLLSSSGIIVKQVPAINISGLALHSSKVSPGCLFLSLLDAQQRPGKQEYIKQAIANGAAAILVDATVADCSGQDQLPIIPVVNLRNYVAPLASFWWQHPQRQLKLLGVTGTNGKTSCTNFLAQLLQQLQRNCGLIGTLGNGMYGNLRSSAMTTPDTLSLYQNLADCVQQQAEYVALEVSSHALAQDRIAGLAFAAAIFTNLTQDHLDYHGDMRSYAQAKQRLFTDYAVTKAIINLDDAYGRHLVQLLPSRDVIGYSVTDLGLQLKSYSHLGAQIPCVYAVGAKFSPWQITAKVVTPVGNGLLVAPLVGAINLSNLLAVLATLIALGYPLEAILAAITKLQSVPGRMQLLGGGTRPWVLLDYAHTPDALTQILPELQTYCQGKLYCVFGCGGERDKLKRPLMGAIAEQYADQVVLTNDNPRHEEARTIIGDILAGMRKPEQAIINLDRGQAIIDTIHGAKQGDYVVVAGKGAETYQDLGARILNFSDYKVIMTSLESYSNAISS